MKIKNLTITNINSSGHGYTFYKNKKIFVLGVFPGDIINVKIYKTIKDVHYAETEKFISLSPLRETTEIDFPSNIPWKNLSQKGEIQLKNNILQEIYSNIPKRKIHKIKKYNPLLQTRYRNKVAYAFDQNNQGVLYFALYSRGRSDKKKNEQKTNILVHPSLEKVSQIFLNFFNNKKILLSEIKYLILRYSYIDNTVVAHILLPQENKKNIPFKKTELENLLKQHHQIQGVLVSYSPLAIRSALTKKDFYTLGKIDIQEKVLHKKYLYHPSLFFQVYPKAFEFILKDIRKELLNISNHRKYDLLDLFSGVGIIGIEISDLVKNVTGIELSTLSKKYAEINSKKNNISNFKFIESSIEHVLDYIKNDKILVIDPPRSGLSKKTISVILEKTPPYIFYISCNPETQKKDFEIIKNKYNIIFLKGYNLFPKTHHIETLLVLEKKE